MDIKEERRKLAEWEARFRAQYTPIPQSWTAFRPKSRLKTDGTPRQAEERHFANAPINTHALAAAKEKALRSRVRLAKYSGKGRK